MQRTATVAGVDFENSTREPTGTHCPDRERVSLVRPDFNPAALQVAFQRCRGRIRRTCESRVVATSNATLAAEVTWNDRRILYGRNNASYCQLLYSQNLGSGGKL